MTHPFSQTLLDWYATHGRELPWRETTDPYRIWISEIILQQTRVAQGYDYYLRFVERFPTVEVLAAATEDEVLHRWEGLGYYSRARNLHAAAQQIVAQGGFPRDYAGVAGTQRGGRLYGGGHLFVCLRPAHGGGGWECLSRAGTLFCHRHAHRCGRRQERVCSTGPIH